MILMVNNVDYVVKSKPNRFAELSVDPSKLKIRALRINHIGYYINRTWQRTSGGFRHWTMLYITGGGGSYRCGDQPRQAVQADSLFFVWPGETFHYGPPPGGYWDEYFISFEGSRVHEWLEEGLISPRLVSRVEGNLNIVERIEQMFDLIESGLPLNHDRSAIILESVLLDCAAQVDSGSASALQRTERKSRIINAITDCLFQPFDADSLAAQLHVSLSTLRRAVKDFSGYTLHEYIHRLKTIEAKKLLLNSDISIKQLADSLGYEDAHYFSRLFKKFVGTSPGVFRRTNRAGKGG
jgi:AraC-like DNA-binding protein